MEFTPVEAARFWIKVEKSEEGCWLWTGYITAQGYGNFAVARKGTWAKKYYAHRVAWFLLHGEIEDQVNHFCRNKNCVNPAHLYSGSQSDNMQDTIRDGSNANANKTHCPQGHEYTEENTYVNKRLGRRSCRTCNRERK